VARLPPGAPAAHLLGLLLSGGLVLLALAWCAVTRPTLRRALAVMTCVSIVASPIAWEYDLVLLIVPAMESVTVARRCEPGRRMVLAALVAIAAALYIPAALWHSLFHFDLGPSLLVLLIAGLLAISSRGSQAHLAQARG
jgi:hypothetical protein